MTSKIHQNSDTCLIESIGGLSYIYKYMHGVIDISKYNNKIVIQRTAVILDHLILIELDKDKSTSDYTITFNYENTDVSFELQYDSEIIVNRIYEFCLKCYCAYKAGNSIMVSDQTKPKKKKTRSPLRQGSGSSSISVTSQKTEKSIEKGEKSFPDTKNLPTPSLRSNLYPVLNEEFNFPDPPKFDFDQPLITL